MNNLSGLPDDALSELVDEPFARWTMKRPATLRVDRGSVWISERSSDFMCSPGVKRLGYIKS
jgi:hypothetical protein